MKYLLLCIAAMFSYPSFAQLSPAELRKHAESEKHQERVQQREVRAEEYKQKMDSTIMSMNYTFSPFTYSAQMGTSTRAINNPDIMLSVTGNEVDINLPYMRGIEPPFSTTMLNYTIVPNDYQAVQTDQGWNISFKSSLFSVYTYTFTMSIVSATGEATLNIATDFNSTVTYSGTISGNN